MKDITVRALEFAIDAHKHQVRKLEKDKPYILHPIAVGEILREYGADNNVIAAGYLHDVIEDTLYTYYNIKNEFGYDISNLVQKTSVSYNNLTWETKKNIFINKASLLSLREKLVILADKINDLEDLNRSFSNYGENYSSFERGKKHQEWYHKSLYNSIVGNESKDNELFQRYYRAIIRLFGLTDEEKKSYEEECLKCENFEQLQNDSFCLKEYYEEKLKSLKNCPVKSFKINKF